MCTPLEYTLLILLLSIHLGLISVEKFRSSEFKSRTKHDKLLFTPVSFLLEVFASAEGRIGFR
jgi:hypothetical protein